MADFLKLCKIIVETEGNPRALDVLNCGYTIEHFIKMCNPSVKKETLVKNARENLINHGIDCKEEI